MSEAIKPPSDALPCPFCGSDARHDAHADDCYFILHQKLNTVPDADLSLALEVLAAWNRRSGQLVERVKELEAVVKAALKTAQMEEQPFRNWHNQAVDVLGKAIKEPSP